MLTQVQRTPVVARSRRATPSRAVAEARARGSSTSRHARRPDGSFARSERFSVRYADAWSATGCALPGASRPTVPKESCACAAGLRPPRTAAPYPLRYPEAALAGARDRNHAGVARRRHPVAASDRRTRAEPRGTPPHPVAGAWSLHLVSEPGDYIGQGGIYDFGPPADRIDASGTPGYLSFSVLPGGTAPDWAAGFFAPRGRRYARVPPITTRPSTTRHPAMPGWR